MENDTHHCAIASTCGRSRLHLLKAENETSDAQEQPRLVYSVHKCRR